MDKEKTKKELLWQLSQLMEYSPPKELKESLESIFREYLGSLSNDAIPLRLKETISDYHNLIYFVERLESLSTPPPNNTESK